MSITVIVAFVMVAGAAISAYNYSSRAIQTGEDIEKSQELLGGLESILSIMTDMKAQADTFINTGDQSAQARYAKDKASLGKYIKFVKLKGDEEGWRRWHFAYLEQLAERFQNSLDIALLDRKNGKPGSAAPDLDKAQQLMEMIRGRLIISDVDERSQLRDRLRDYKHHAEQTSIMFLSLGGFIFLFVVPLTLIVQRYIGATQKAMLVEQQVSREIVQHAPIGILQLNADFTIKDINPVFAEYLPEGASALGKSVWDLLPELPKQELTETVTAGKPSTIPGVLITRIADKTGLESYWDIAAWPMLEADKVRSLIILIEDISDKTILSRQKEVLQQTIAHDLKSPLIASNYLIQAMLKKHSAAKNGDHELLLRLQDSNQDALTMVKNMLEISKYRQGYHLLSLQSIELDHLILEITKNFESRCQLSEVTIDVQKPAEPICLESDSNALRHLIGNLVENAIKFSPTKSTVTIKLKNDDQNVTIDVNNTGPTIHEDDKEKLFTPFWQGEIGQQSAGGTGIGLYLCQQIAHTLGGSITFTSDEKSGTTFTVVLPCTSKENATA
ncbi:MAG: GHKL domain-containing protein [Cyanobacteria bacterium SZAS-4]|nr:GHKL domain-containing protein [Cyanobacteria bacterium SZAS-4]